MSFVAAIPLAFFVLLVLWGAWRELRRVLGERKTIARLKQSGVLQQGTIMSIDLKRSSSVAYGKVVFQYKVNKTTYWGKHTMSAAAAKTLRKEDREVSIRYLPDHPRSARIDGVLTDSFETTRALIMGCALLACLLLVMGAMGVGWVLHWKIEAIEIFAVLVFSLGGLLSMGIASLALRFFLG